VYHQPPFAKARTRPTGPASPTNRVAGVGLPGNTRHLLVLTTAARPQQSLHVITPSVFGTHNQAERRCAYPERSRTALGAICRGSLCEARTRLAADRPSHPSASADTFSFVVPPTEPSLGPLPICVDQFLQYIFQRFNLLVPAVAEGGHQAVDGTRG
jgi:hypothetical protein